MRVIVRVAFVLIALAVLSAAPEALALPGTGTETYFYNYGSIWPDGEQIHDCYGWSWADGDRTPSNGELKVVITINCSTDETTEQWWRYQTDCTGGFWYVIPEPFYSDEEIC